MANRLKLVVALLSVFSLFSITLLGQSRRVVIVKPGDAELRRAAARLRMCPEQVQNIRQVLDEASDLLPEVTSGPGGIGMMLFRFNRPKAEETVIRLVEELGSKARQATNQPEYQRLTTCASELINAMERSNPTLALKLEDQWPKGSFPESDPGSLKRGAPHVDYLAQQQFFRTAQRNPEEALRQLHTLSPSAQYSARSLLVNGLFDKGMESEARRLVDDTLAAPVGEPTPVNTSQFGQFARSALELFPDSAERVFGALATMYQALVQAGEPSTMSFTLPNGQTLQVNRADQFLLSQIMMSNSDPQFASRLVGLSPQINQKVQSGGGYSSFFRYNHRRLRQSRQKLADTPDEQLESKFADSSPTDLMRSAAEACYEFPEKAEKLYDLALRKIEAESDLPKAVNDFEQVSPNCARCLGELPEKWLLAGKELLGKARQKEQEGSAALPPNVGRLPTAYGISGPRTPSSRLESLLIAFKADGDFAGAMQDARAIEDKSKRYETLMRIAQHLTNR